MSVLILSEVNRRNGETKRLDVVRAAESRSAALEGIQEGEYKVLEGDQVATVRVSYRTVQDVETV